VSFLQGFVLGILEGRTARQRRNGFIVLLLLTVVGAALFIWNAVHKGEGYFNIIFATLALAMVMTLVLSVSDYVEARKLPRGGQCFNLLILLVIFAGAIGQWLGHSVKETSLFNQDITLKDKDQTLANAKLIIVMSRHTVLTKDDVLYVLPTSDITKFQSVAKQKPK
jgi:hypothetical protein